VTGSLITFTNVFDGDIFHIYSIEKQKFICSIFSKISVFFWGGGRGSLKSRGCRLSASMNEANKAYT